MINCNTSFGKLKAVIVGCELELNSRIIDITFKHFYKEAIGNGIYNSRHELYNISNDILQLRIQQLDKLAEILQQFGITVYRPDKVSAVHKIKTPTYETEASSASNVRDLTFIYNNKIIETPICIRNRIFENTNLYKIFAKCFNNGIDGGQWIKAPLTHLTEDTYDFLDWRCQRNFSNIPEKIEMAIDAPNFITIGKDVIVNVATYSQYLGYLWVKSLFPESVFHVIKCVDSHLDGTLVCLRPGVFLLNPKYAYLPEMLPKKFRSWKFIIPKDITKPLDIHGLTDIDIQLASSRGMDINVLSIDEHKVLVNAKATGVIKALDENGFEPIIIELDYGEIFAGGIHCSTLDLIREDSYMFYD